MLIAAVDAASGDVYACDAEADDVWRLLRDGTLVGSVGKLGHEACDFNDRTGELFAGPEDFASFNRRVGGSANTYGDLPGSSTSEALAVDPRSGDVFVGANRSYAEIYRYRDLNRDGDGLDPGERTLFHSFLPNSEEEGEIEALAADGGRSVEPAPALSAAAMAVLCLVLLVIGGAEVRRQKRTASGMTSW